MSFRLKASVPLLLPILLTSSTCRRTAGPASSDAPARVFLVYNPSAAYQPPGTQLVFRLDDGSGERILSERDFPSGVLQGTPIFRDTRTSGSLRVRVALLSANDTLATAKTELPLAPDRQWDIALMPGARFPAEPAVPPFRPLPGFYVVAPIRVHGAPVPGDSLFVAWDQQSISNPRVTELSAPSFDARVRCSARRDGTSNHQRTGWDSNARYAMNVRKLSRGLST